MPKKDKSLASFKSLSPATMRASTVVFDNLDDFVHREKRLPDGFSYGVTGTPTTRLLEKKIASLENGAHCIVTPSGAAALMTTVLGFVRGGDHLLISASCYGSLKIFADKWLASMGVEVELYPPRIGADIAEFLRPNTKMICLETPGSITMEMQDIPAIAEVAKRHGVLTMQDNTWASPLGFCPLSHGVDFSIEAATKFFSGHSDVLMGCISMNDQDHYETLRMAQDVLGQHVSPDDCFLVLRGLETLKLRLDTQSMSTAKIASYISEHPLVDRVFYPPLESDPGHAIWKRDFKTNGCLFSMALKPANQEAISSFFSSLKTFSIGASWGGAHSLAAYYPSHLQSDRPYSTSDQSLVRLSIGLEDPNSLIADLDQALNVYTKTTALS